MLNDFHRHVAELRIDSGFPAQWRPIIEINLHRPSHRDPACDSLDCRAARRCPVPASPCGSVRMRTRQAARNSKPMYRLVRPCFIGRLNSNLVSVARWAK
jgi:hypothetical protein